MAHHIFTSGGTSGLNPKSACFHESHPEYRCCDSSQLTESVFAVWTHCAKNRRRSAIAAARYGLLRRERLVDKSRNGVGIEHSHNKMRSDLLRSGTGGVMLFRSIRTRAPR